MQTADRCQETTTSTGTGDVVLLGATLQFQSFIQAFGSSPVDEIPYAIVAHTGSEWEVGYGTFDGIDTLSRDVVTQSSNSNSHVNFTAGTKDVFATINADFLNLPELLFVKKSVDSNDKRTVPEGHQLIVFGSYEVNGTLDCEGDLVIL